ncbi:hypothetical protein NKI51_10710 [Mesorhizobium australicum]|uniref:hypothetical protein n=1 Tax=Mesorhizobium australicum TaxID=536018 RepID=UPI00333C86DD
MLRIPQSQFLSPDDLAICQRVFDQICVDAKLDRASVDGVTLALTVLAAFQNGIVADDELLAAVRARRADFMKHTG